MAAAANGGLLWCGSLGSADWLGLALSPCAVETTASGVLLAAALLSLLAQGGLIGVLAQMKAQGRLRRGVSGVNGAFIACGMFLSGTHLLHFSVGVALLRAWPFHIAYHACLALVWVLVTALALYSGRLSASLDFRITTAGAAAAYLISLYFFYRLYFDPHAVPLPYIKASIWTAMLQTVVAAIATWLGVRRAARSPSLTALQAQLGLGYDALPADADADADADAGAAAPPRRAGSGAAASTSGAAKPPGGSGADAGIFDADDADKRTWITLFGEACTYVWPESLGLQLRAIGCLLLLICMRFLNLAVPILYKRVVDTLAAAAAASRHSTPSSSAAAAATAAGGGAGRGLGLDLGLGRILAAAFASGGGGGLGDGGGGGGDTPAHVAFGRLVWPWVVLYLAAVFFQGGAGGGIVGFINNLRSFLWIPVSQDAYRRISLRVFDHVMALDLSFHLRKKTGEVTKVVDRGTNAMQNILSTILFSVLPQIFDVLAAATYLAQALEPTIAIIVFVTVGSYIPLTVTITEWRGKLRREMNQTDQVKSARATDALLNYETVKYFTNERHESGQYAAAIDAYQSAEFRSMSSINVLNVVQSVIMFCGIASGLLVCAAGVANGALTVGDAVLFLSLMAQLYGPLNFFGSYYRTIQQYMIDMENLLELLGRRGGVEDAPHAADLVVAKGELVFDDVSFAYEPGHQVLRHVSFRVPGGRTIAFVGATGSGKSTITRLIFRFYDVSSGAIRIDGQDIRNVTQTSLRRAVGMVPQDTVLFNDTILHNIRYGNLSATDEQVHEAAKLACIHETIVTRFPKGYDTIVGERGLRLSGGEKQRVAFARALLKNPAMLVLDEATSALDTITEKKIQSALADLRASRTTAIVAHRLSTIADADLIVVMALGAVVEAGAHAELLGRGGLYAEMWSKQAQAAQAETSNAGSASLRSSAVDLQALARPSGPGAGGPSTAPSGGDLPAADAAAAAAGPTVVAAPEVTAAAAAGTATASAGSGDGVVSEGSAAAETHVAPAAAATGQTGAEAAASAAAEAGAASGASGSAGAGVESSAAGGGEGAAASGGGSAAAVGAAAGGGGGKGKQRKGRR